MRPFRFGICFTGHVDSKQWADLARRVEGEGFSQLLVADHYMNPMACGPLILAAALETTTLRVGSYVYNNDFRHPALLAKEVATIDVLSGGRVDFGMGAGWAKEEYDAVGLPFDPPAVRAERFEEAVDVVVRLLAGETVSHAGAHYQLRELAGSPKPAQSRVPLLIGGGGPRMLRFAARVADIVALVPRSLAEGGLDLSEFAPDVVDKKIGWVRDAAAAAGRGAAGPDLSVMVFALGTSPDKAARSGYMSAEMASVSPHALVGSPAQIVETLHERRERWGLSTYVVFEDQLERTIPVLKALA